MCRLVYFPDISRTHIWKKGSDLLIRVAHKGGSLPLANYYYVVMCMCVVQLTADAEIKQCIDEATSRIALGNQSL